MTKRCKHITHVYVFDAGTKTKKKKRTKKKNTEKQNEKQIFFIISLTKQQTGGK